MRKIEIIIFTGSVLLHDHLKWEKYNWNTSVIIKIALSGTICTHSVYGNGAALTFIKHCIKAEMRNRKNSLTFYRESMSVVVSLLIG